MMKTTFLLIFQALLFTSLAFAQTPVLLPTTKGHNGPNSSFESCTNYAGTLETGQFIGMSNDIDLDTIVLCFGDSILIHHLGDADLSGDPQPATEPGVTYGFYSCAPTISGPTFQDISNLPGPGDSCILQGSIPGALYVTQGIPNGGDTWFFNNGWIQSTFNFGQPFGVIFAPMTVDDYTTTYFEYAQPGALPGPCVNVNIAAAFKVIYLNAIRPSAISNHAGNDCLGQFMVSGGYPEYDPAGTYSIDIMLASNPSVKAQLLTTPSNLLNFANVQFSVSTPGVYSVNIEDGKSCGKQFQIDMSGCNSVDNVVLEVGKEVAAPGEQVCLPLKVQNFDIVSGSFSISWNPNLLKYTHIAQYHPAILPFFNPNTMTNSSQVSSGKLSIALFDSNNLGEVISIPDAENLLELCFEVLDTSDSNCIPVTISNALTGIFMEDFQGQLLGVTLLDGGVCKSVSALEPNRMHLTSLFPNPSHAGEFCYWTLQSTKNTLAQWQIRSSQGVLVRTEPLELSVGENQGALKSSALTPGVYFVTLKTSEAQNFQFKWVIL